VNYLYPKAENSKKSSFGIKKQKETRIKAEKSRIFLALFQKMWYADRVILFHI